MTRRGVLTLGLAFGIAAVNTLFALRVVERTEAAYSIGGLHDVLAALQYGALPAVVLCAILFWLGPGLMLTLCYAAVRRSTGWLVSAFAASLVTHVATVPVAIAIGGAPVSRSVYLAVHAATGLAAWALLWRRAGQSPALPSPLSARVDTRRAIVVGLIAMAGLMGLLPFLFWQDLNPDGLEAMAVGQSLSRSMLPQSLTAEALTTGSGLVTQAYLSHGFLMLFGETEGALRLPLLLLLPVAFAALVDLAEWQSTSRLSWREESLVALALASYTAVMAFNASYDPYFADIAAPMVEDTVLVVCILGMLLAMAEERVSLMVVYGAMASFSRPTGLLFVVGMLPATLFVTRGYRPAWTRHAGLVIAVCLGAIAVYETVVVPLLVGTSITRAGAEVLGRLRYLAFFDWPRLAYVVVPSGVLPAVAVLYFRRQDALARIVSVLTVAFFAFFYVTAFVALHHFVIGMILPLIVFWRLYLAAPAQRRRVALPLAWVACLLSLWSSLPRRFDVNRTARHIGRRTLIGVGSPDEDLRSLARRVEVLAAIARYDWWVEDPATEFVSAPATVAFYADRGGAALARHDYVVLPARDPSPLGMALVAEEAGVSLYARDRATLDADRFRAQPTDYRSPLYDMPRVTLFRHWGEPAHHYDLDLAAIAGLRRTR